MDSYTKLLIHADGADASTAFYDFSNSAHAITTVGTAQVDTAQSKFGGASLLVNGSTDYLTAPDNADWYFGTSNFTIDCWVRWNNNSGYQYICGQYEDANNRWFVGLYSGNLAIYFEDGGVDLGFYTVAFTPTVGTWYHLAFEREGTGASIFIDGVSQTLTTGTAFGTNDVGDIASVLYVGRETPAAYLNGWIDELRISKGIARWTANFTPPTRAYNELDGDRDVLYKLILRMISGANSNDYYSYLNYDNGTNYGDQRLIAYGATINAARVTGKTQLLEALERGASTNGLSLYDILFYAKSGFNKAALTSGTDRISGTTVTMVDLNGDTWSNVTDKITSWRIVSGQTSGLGIGTHVELWRLNL